ncbi:MAG: enoyl-CoA hydratase/isomerase family protein [Candidatus Aminicenantes bacterium]|nr:enoyl-CoA hydratase/isomerase family protein [Candidatus Aminicenantes bacterium]
MLKLLACGREQQEATMSQENGFEFEDRFLKAYFSEGIAVIRVQADSVATLTDLAESGRFLKLFHEAEVNNQVRALLLMGNPGGFADGEYEKFICKEEAALGQPGQATHLKTQVIRHINILNRIVTQMADFKKIFAVGLQQSVVTPFFGASLAADFRFASRDMFFSPAHCRHGLHPTGALPYFLPRYIGQGQAAEILFKGEPLDAATLLDLGLITEVLAADDFERRCIEALQPWCALPGEVILSSKLLLNHANRLGLKRYFDTEAALLH